MGLSKSYKELIEDWGMAVESNSGYTIYNYYTASAWLLIRDDIHNAGLDEDEKVKALDIQAIENALKYGAEMPMGRDDENHPLQFWWWYLDRIAEKNYPAELLPEYLREIYLKAF